MIAHLENISTAALIARMERAPDFGYDDEAEELTARLSAEGKEWRWATDTRIEVRNAPKEG